MWIALGLTLWMCLLFVLSKLSISRKKQRKAPPKQQEVFLTAEQTREVIGRLRSQLEAGANEKDVRSQRKIDCPACMGHYLMCKTPSGYSIKCTNSPKCTATATPKEYILQAIAIYGVKLYCWKRECWCCSTEIPIYSYYLAHDFKDLIPQLHQSEELGIGNIPLLDELIAQQFPSIQLRYSQTAGGRYYANTCPTCHRLQGHYYVVEDPHEIFGALYGGEELDDYLVDVLKITDEAVLYQIADIILQSI